MTQMAIYLHKGCFDGVTSGALALWLLRKQGGDANPVFVPIDYDESATWLAQSLGSGSCVVDFLYHPSATYWWDHHGNPFRLPQWRKEYELRISPFISWDPSAKSCAGLMVRALTAAEFKIPIHLRRTADWADQIDSASYPTPEDAVVKPSPARQLALSLRVDSTAAYHTALAQALIETDVEEVVLRPPFRSAVENAKARYERGIERIRSTAKLDRDVVIYNLDEEDVLGDRLIPFFLHRKANYSLGIWRIGRRVKVTANANPWQPPHDLDLGRIFTHYGGGGHHDVGSVILKDSDAMRPEAVLQKILNAIQA